MADTLVNAEALTRWLGYERDGDIARWLLREHRIPYWYGKDRRPVTTLAAINRALLGDESPKKIEFEDDDFDFEGLPPGSRKQKKR